MPNPDNRLEIIRNIVRANYVMRNESPKNDRQMLTRCLNISKWVMQQTEKEECELFLEACRRNWFNDLDESQRRLIQYIDIVEMIAKDVVISKRPGELHLS